MVGYSRVAGPLNITRTVYSIPSEASAGVLTTRKRPILCMFCMSPGDLDLLLSAIFKPVLLSLLYPQHMYKR